MSIKKKVQVYSDGSATTADNPGGWAFVIVVDGQKTSEGSGGLKNCTNNVAELTAALKGLEFVKATMILDEVEIELISDSQLVLNYTNGKWQCKKLHLALLHSKLRKLNDELNLTTTWVRGHTGVPNNERCDELAKAEREKMICANSAQNV